MEKKNKTLCLNGRLLSKQVQYSESSSQHKILWDFMGWSARTACFSLECTNKSIMSSSNISHTSVVYSPACSLEGFALLSLPLLTHHLLFEATPPPPMCLISSQIPAHYFWNTSPHDLGQISSHWSVKLDILSKTNLGKVHITAAAHYFHNNKNKTLSNINRKQ